MLSDQFIDSSLHHNLMNHMTYGVSFSPSPPRTPYRSRRRPRSGTTPVGKGDALVRSVDPDGGGSVIDRVCALSVDTEVLVEAIDAIAGSSKRERPQALWTPTLHAPVSFADIDEIDLPPRTVQIGVLDDPFHHTRNPFTVSLDGNTVVCGSSGAGKTTTISSHRHGGATCTFGGSVLYHRLTWVTWTSEGLLQCRRLRPGERPGSCESCHRGVHRWWLGGR